MNVPPIFDLQEALARLGGDRELLAEVFTLAEADLPAMLKRLTSAVHAADIAATAREAHALKGVLGNVSARRAFLLAKAMEDAAVAGHSRDAVTNLSQLSTEIHSFIEEFRRTMA